MFNRRAIAAGFFVLMAVMPVMTAQTSRATLSGIVTDPSGARIVTAKIELTNLEQKTVRTAQPNDSGLYRFDAVDPGNYSLRVTADGFSSYEVPLVTLTGAQVASVDVKLQVGPATSVVEVTEEALPLQAETPVHMGAISPVQSTELPVAGRNPVMLALTLPGVSTNRGGPGQDTFVVNGARGRSNNFLLDGTENNDISVAGQAFEITNPDAVQEVVVQTSNYDAEFGRAGGAVINTIIRSGTNEFHGTASTLFEFTRLNALTNQEALNADAVKRGHPLPGTDQWFSGTLGGPIQKNKTFFFVAYQQRRLFSSSTVTRTLVSANGKAKLRSLFPEGTNANVDNYLAGIGPDLANTQFQTEDLGLGRGLLETGTLVRAYRQTLRDHEPIVKIDHQFNERNLLTGRFALEDLSIPGSSTLTFTGFDTGIAARNINAHTAYTRILSATATNEVRVSYNRIRYSFPNDASNPLGETLPAITIAGYSAVGVNSAIPQGRTANNYSLQDTVSIIRGRHAFRFGADLLLQRAVQVAPMAQRGVLNFAGSGDFSAWANFIDNYGGSGGIASRDFGNNTYYPDLFRHAYFFQDRWRTSDSLTLSLGLRYEYFGLPMNSIGTPAYTGLFNIDPKTFTGPYNQPNKVEPDKNNWAPSIGLAWAPSVKDGWLGKLFGDKLSVWRMGYQIGYDSFFNNIASNAAASSPNLISTSFTSSVDTANPRGTQDFSNSVPNVPRATSPIDQQLLMISNLRNPYYQRWSGGIQRTLPRNVVLDISYVGSKGTRLYINEDYNPTVPANYRILPAGLTAKDVPYTLPGRLDNLQGSRQVRTNGGSSSYHSLQVEARRRISKGLLFAGSYTYSKLIDNASEVFSLSGFANSSLAAVPAIFGGQARERAVSAFDRTQRAVFSWVYDLPFYTAQNGLLGHVAGGWRASGIATFESGVPFSVTNGLDADGFAGSGDRPDFNPNGQPGVRAKYSASSPTHYINPDAGNAPIDPATAEFIQLQSCTSAAGCRTGNLGRNTQRSPGIANWDMTFTKSTQIGERFRTELKAEFFNIFNHPQFGYAGQGAFQPTSPAMSSNVQSSLAGRFLNPLYMDGGARVVRLGLKILF